MKDSLPEKHPCKKMTQLKEGNNDIMHSKHDSFHTSQRQGRDNYILKINVIFLQSESSLKLFSQLDNMHESEDFKESLLVKPKHSQKQSKTNSTETNLDSNQGLLLAPQPLRTASRSTKLLTALQGFKLGLTLLLRSLLLSCEENYLWTIVTMSTGPSLHMSGLRERSLSFLL